MLACYLGTKAKAVYAVSWTACGSTRGPISVILLSLPTRKTVLLAHSWVLSVSSDGLGTREILLVLMTIRTSLQQQVSQDPRGLRTQAGLNPPGRPSGGDSRAQEVSLHLGRSQSVAAETSLVLF